MNTNVKKIYIYVLIDPKTEYIRYVGNTINPTKRLQNHIRRSKYLKYHSAVWIKSLLDNGLQPIMNIIEIADENTWEVREKYWIDFYRNQPYELTNILDGGQGAHGGKGNPKPWTDEQRENYKKGRTGIKMLNQNDKNGLRTAAIRAYRAKTAKPICQYDLQGNFIREWTSSVECGKELGFCYSNINVVLNKGNRRQAHGFMWRYKTKDIILKIEPYVEPVAHNCKNVLKINKNGDIVNEYPSISLAAKENGILRSSITNCLYGRARTSGGFIWKYKEE